MDDLNTEHAGRFGRLWKEISGPINCTRLALMIKLSSQLILIKVNNTRGVTLFTPSPSRVGHPGDPYGALSSHLGNPQLISFLLFIL